MRLERRPSEDAAVFSIHPITAVVDCRKHRLSEPRKRELIFLTRWRNVIKRPKINQQLKEKVIRHSETRLVSIFVVSYGRMPRVELPIQNDPDA